MSTRHPRRWPLAGAIFASTGAVAAAVLLVSTAAWAASNTVTIPSQGGNTKVVVSPGQLVYAGYDFTYPSIAPNTTSVTTEINNTSAVLSVGCDDGSTPSQSSITITIPDENYTANAGNWAPSSDQSDPSVYQGSIAMPDLCNGGAMDVGQNKGANTMGPFNGDFYSSAASSDPSQDTVHVRWHYGTASDLSSNGGTGTSWSSTQSGTPDPLTGVSVFPAAGRWAPGALIVVFAGSALGMVVYRRRRRAVPKG
ncbi:MAG TPA: hypothetical protein VMR97_06875 [Acidimicrobiales bacterium]|nr:hypothetical protein [Acidimicrobiales bacterium]